VSKRPTSKKPSDANDVLRQAGPDELRKNLDGARIKPRLVASNDVPRAEPEPEGFKLTASDTIAKTEGNIRHALRLDGIELSYDEFARQRIVSGLQGHGPQLTDVAIEAMWIKFEREYRVSFQRKHFEAVLRVEAHANRYHPVCDYLAGLRWDGIPRLDRWLVTYARAADTEINRQFGRLTLIAAVRRVRCPGTKFDAMLVLEGREGLSKSTLFEVLAGSDWFSDDAPLHADARQTIEQLRGHWIIEAADLSAVNRTEVDRLKAFLARTKDVGTLKFERETTTAPRQCIFVGTTNSYEYLLSKTGNRRFWPVRVGRIDVEALRRDRDQIWAEAAQAEASGASIMLPEALWIVAGEEQEKRRKTDLWEGAIERFLDARRELEKPWVSPAEVAQQVLTMTLKDLDGTVKSRLFEAMRLAGWSKESGKKVNGLRLWGPDQTR
jgi:predicted P-loop ATPase